MGAEIVCQVTNQDSQVEFTWSLGGGFFRPYVVAGAQLTELREATRSVRKALEAVVYALDQAGDGPALGAILRACGGRFPAPQLHPADRG